MLWCYSKCYGKCYGECYVKCYRKCYGKCYGECYGKCYGVMVSVTVSVMVSVRCVFLLPLRMSRTLVFSLTNTRALTLYVPVALHAKCLSLFFPILFYTEK